MEQFEEQHAKVRNKEDSFDISIFDQHGSSRLSTGSTFCTKPPKSHSSPERDSDVESTKERIMADFTFKPIQTDDDEEAEKPFIPLASRIKSRPGSLSSQHAPSVVSSGYPVSNASYPYPPPPGSYYPPSQVSRQMEPLRSYSPVPLVDYPSLIDFREPVFVEAVETNQLPIRMNASVPWIRVELSFRSVRLETGPTESNPFVVRDKEFILHPNQHHQVAIKFQPRTGGSYTALLELQLVYHDQYNRPITQTHTVNVIGQARVLFFFNFQVW